MYNANFFMSPNNNFNSERLHEIRDRESATRASRAKALMEQVKQERKEAGKASQRFPVLVCRRMKHLPKPGIY